MSPFGESLLVAARPRRQRPGDSVRVEHQLRFSMKSRRGAVPVRLSPWAARRRGRRGRRRRRPRAARRSGTRPGTRGAGRARPGIRPAGCGAARRRRPTASAAAGGSFGRTTVRTGSPASRRSRYRRWRSALVMPTGGHCSRYVTADPITEIMGSPRRAAVGPRGNQRLPDLAGLQVEPLGERPGDGAPPRRLPLRRLGGRAFGRAIHARPYSPGRARPCRARVALFPVQVLPPPPVRLRAAARPPQGWTISADRGSLHPAAADGRTDAVRASKGQMSRVFPFAGVFVRLTPPAA